jgi:hypothetical protein
MHVIKFQRRVRKGNYGASSASRRSIRQFGREFVAKENHIEFVIEALLFGVLVAVSAWPWRRRERSTNFCKKAACQTGGFR